MEKKAIHHTPTREYSHAWGERAKTEQTRPGDFPLEQPSDTGKQNRKSPVRHFFSLTGIGKNDRNHDPAIAENDSPSHLENLESRLYSLQDLLSDYRWTAETEIIDRTSDAVVHLDQMANDYRASVRAELEKFRDETGDKSLLRRSLIDSALRRLSGASGQRHHAIPAGNNKTSQKQKPPVYFNYFPRAGKRE